MPVLTGRPVTSRRLGRWLFGVWNFAVILPGWVLVLAGVSQPLEWAEFPLVVDASSMLGLLLAAVQFLPAASSRAGCESLYVSSWYIIGGLVFTLLAYPMGNIVPELVPGASGAAFSGLWIHDAIGLFVTPLALAIIYFVIPAVHRPADLQPLPVDARVLAAVLPLSAERHAPLRVLRRSRWRRRWARSPPRPSSGVDVIIVVTNLLLSLRGAGIVGADMPLRFVWHRHGRSTSSSACRARRRRRWRSTRRCTSPTG